VLSREVPKSKLSLSQKPLIFCSKSTIASDMFSADLLQLMGNCNWLRHYATSRKITGSIAGEITGFFNLPDPSSRTVALG
jgi:hypothetical protein